MDCFQRVDHNKISNLSSTLQRRRPNSWVRRGPLGIGEVVPDLSEKGSKTDLFHGWSPQIIAQAKYAFQLSINSKQNVWRIISRVDYLCPQSLSFSFWLIRCSAFCSFCSLPYFSHYWAPYLPNVCHLLSILINWLVDAFWFLCFEKKIHYFLVRTEANYCGAASEDQQTLAEVSIYANIRDEFFYIENFPRY